MIDTKRALSLATITGMTVWKLENESKNFKWITKDDEKVIDDFVKQWIDRNTAYSQVLQARKDREFVKNRDKLRNDLIYQQSQVKDPIIKRQMDMIIKQSQVADFIRNKQMDRGVMWSSDKEDSELLGMINQSNPKSLAKFGDLVNGGMDINTFTKWMDNILNGRWFNQDEWQSNQGARNIAWWVATSLQWIPNAIEKGKSSIKKWQNTVLGRLVRGIGKLFWNDDLKEKGQFMIDEANLQDKKVKSIIKNNDFGDMLGANEDSTGYQVAKWITDIAQTVALPWWAWKATTIWGKIVKWAVWGVIDTAKYQAISESRLPTKKELAIWWVVWWWLSGVWHLMQKWIKKVSDTLQTAGMINPSDLKNIAKTMHSEKDIWNVSNWMLKNNMIGTKEGIIKKLDDFTETNYKNTKLALSKSKTLHKVPWAEWALLKLKKAFGWDEVEAWLEDIYNQVDKLINKSQTKWLTLKDLNMVQKLQWEYLPNFAKAWSDVKDSLQAKANAKLYNQVKEYIEKVGIKEWIGDIKNLKKDTQIANMLKYAITKKEAWDYARQLVSPFAWGTLGWMAWFTTSNWSLEDKIKGWIKWAALWWLAWSKVLQSYIAKYLRNVGENWLMKLLKRWLTVKAADIWKQQ